ncbi:Antitoxin [Pseudomonas chlororaphis]
MKRDYQPHHHDPATDEINFDLTRMKKAVESGQRFTMPEGMKREEFREWMRENAKKCRSTQ